MGALVASLAGHGRARADGAFDHSFGLGGSLGAPTAVTGEARLSRRLSLQFALGLDAPPLAGPNAVWFHVDLLTYVADLTPGWEGLQVSPFVGLGLQVHDHVTAGFGEDAGYGLRAPFGLALAFRTLRAQLIIELSINQIDARHRLLGEAPHFLGGGLGLRIYFF